MNSVFLLQKQTLLLSFKCHYLTFSTLIDLQKNLFLFYQHISPFITLLLCLLLIKRTQYDDFLYVVHSLFYDLFLFFLADCQTFWAIIQKIQSANPPMNTITQWTAILFVLPSNAVSIGYIYVIHLNILVLLIRYYCVICNSYGHNNA